MASITSCSTAASVSCGALVHRKTSVAPPSCIVLGLPSISKMRKVICSNDAKLKVDEKESVSNNNATSLLAVALASGAMTISTPFSALALVDERLSTEGTGLPFGLSNNLLGWLLLGVFGLIWSLYFIYTASLEEDEDSGLSL